ncbi:MAG: insulinase family protein, partial [Cyanobacteria bacterium]|nr:insulinase family protein [Cyanobacteriota bacterium]MDW8200999.1 insulinase family protein [Cyanobacteriota bacterium SKYGB_h_bin112]
IVQAQIQAIFGNWTPSSSPDARAKGQVNQPDQLPVVTQATPGGVFFIDQPQLTQSYVLIGHLGGMSNSPDYPALSVMNNVLNGYGGRLFNELRSRQGLAYSVFAYWDAEFDYPGVFIANGQTRSETTVPFIQRLIAELERLRRSRITPQELAYAKDSTLNSFVFKFQSPSQTLSRLLRYEYYGYPADFLTRYRRGVEATTIVDVERVARFYLKPENFVTLVVGNGREIQPPLTVLAPNDRITQLDITIPD